MKLHTVSHTVLCQTFLTLQISRNHEFHSTISHQFFGNPARPESQKISFPDTNEARFLAQKKKIGYGPETAQVSQNSGFKSHSVWPTIGPIMVAYQESYKTDKL